MTGPRAARPDGLDSAAASWADALRSGAAPEMVAAEILAAPPEQAIGAATNLAQLRSDSAVEVLDQLARLSDDKTVQKAARRSLHYLASQGFRPAESARPTVASVGGRAATLYRAIASSFDGSGSRSVWFAAERPMGGIYFIAVILNDVGGLIDCDGYDTTRKRFIEREATIREKDVASWVELPLDYATQLVQESVDLARSAGTSVPPTYALWADLIGSPSDPFGEALIYRDISAFEARMHPTLQNESPKLFEEPEVEAWFFTPKAVQKWAHRLAEPSSSRLLITPESDEARQARILREAAKDLLPLRSLRGLRRRLEETAYIFLRTDREVQARRAVAAAVTIEEDRPLRPPHPFIRAMIDHSLRIAVQVERSGFEPPTLARAP